MGVIAETAQRVVSCTRPRCRRSVGDGSLQRAAAPYTQGLLRSIPHRPRRHGAAPTGDDSGTVQPSGRDRPGLPLRSRCPFVKSVCTEKDPCSKSEAWHKVPAALLEDTMAETPLLLVKNSRSTFRSRRTFSREWRASTRGQRLLHDSEGRTLGWWASRDAQVHHRRCILRLIERAGGRLRRQNVTALDKRSLRTFAATCRSSSRPYASLNRA